MQNQVSSVALFPIQKAVSLGLALSYMVGRGKRRGDHLPITFMDETDSTWAELIYCQRKIELDGEKEDEN